MMKQETTRRRERGGGTSHVVVVGDPRYSKWAAVQRGDLFLVYLIYVSSITYISISVSSVTYISFLDTQRHYKLRGPNLESETSGPYKQRFLRDPSNEPTGSTSISAYRC